MFLTLFLLLGIRSVGVNTLWPGRTHAFPGSNEPMYVLCLTNAAAATRRRQVKRTAMLCQMSLVPFFLSLAVGFSTSAWAGGPCEPDDKEEQQAYRQLVKWRKTAGVKPESDFSRCRFSANHASNYLPIRGDLPRDKVALLQMLDRVIKTRDESLLKPEFLRGL